MKNILTEALVNLATNASFICSYTNSAKLRFWFRNRGIWYVKKLPNCHNLLIMRNDKKDYRNSQYFGFVFSC